MHHLVKCDTKKTNNNKKGSGVSINHYFQIKMLLLDFIEIFLQKKFFFLSFFNYYLAMLLHSIIKILLHFFCLQHFFLSQQLHCSAKNEMLRCVYKKKTIDTKRTSRRAIISTFCACPLLFCIMYTIEIIFVLLSKRLKRKYHQIIIQNPFNGVVISNTRI